MRLAGCRHGPADCRHIDLVAMRSVTAGDRGVQYAGLSGEMLFQKRYDDRLREYRYDLRHHSPSGLQDFLG